MIRERLATIWSLRRRAAMQVRIYFTAEDHGRCRIFRLHRIEQYES